MNPRVVGMAENIPTWSLWASSVGSRRGSHGVPAWPTLAARRTPLPRVTPAASTMGAWVPGLQRLQESGQSLAQLAMTTAQSETRSTG